MDALFYEDYDRKWQMQSADRSITESDVRQFIALVGMNEPQLSEKADTQEETHFTQLPILGSQTFSYAEGLVIGSGILHTTGIAYLGGELKALKPVYVGDTIRVDVSLHANRVTSKSDRGIVTTHNRVLNQRDELVLEYWPARMIRRRSKS